MAQPSGIDVSRWQGTIDWPAVKQGGVTFAGIRATIGDFFTDDKFAENWQGANEADSVIQDRTFESLQEMEARFGRKPLVYTADWFWIPHIGDQPWVEDYDLWVAHHYWRRCKRRRFPPAGWCIKSGSIPTGAGFPASGETPTSISLVGLWRI